MTDSISLKAHIERKDPQLPRFVVIGSHLVAGWKLTETTTITGTLNGHDIGRRSLKKWDVRRWFIELPQPLCQKAAVDTGEKVSLIIQIASQDLPGELQTLIASNSRAKKAWESLSSGARRMVREQVADGKQSATRSRRAARALGV